LGCEIAFVDWHHCEFVNVEFRLLLIGPSITDEMMKQCSFESVGGKKEWEEITEDTFKKVFKK
jgi:hypothetical protein